MDRLNSEQRSRNMKAIRTKDTSIELILRKALYHKGFRYRKNYKALPGTPDIAITKHRIAIFCDSEFFHGKNWGGVETAFGEWIKQHLLDQKDYPEHGAG